ncbi:MAG TPA: hypothetical protein VNH44_13860 [Micropepsaceae bacterium]|nr:hypothetical protein [Micropepsaceae bacterium]
MHANLVWPISPAACDFIRQQFTGAAGSAIFFRIAPDDVVTLLHVSPGSLHASDFLIM